MTTAKELRARATLWRKGNYFEDFEVGKVFSHHWGRTLTESDNIQFSALTLNYHPAYFNVPYAKALGHPTAVANPMLVFLVVFGLSVEDLSEIGGAFLGVENLTFHRQVSVGETVTARSTVTAVRESDSRPGEGIVTWHTSGFDEHGELLIDFLRTNLISKRPIGDPA